MPKKNVLKANKNRVFNLFMLIVLFLLLALIIPAIGYKETSPIAWISFVDFFIKIRDHFMNFWMFYTFGGFVLFAYLGKK